MAGYGTKTPVHTLPTVLPNQHSTGTVYDTPKYAGQKTPPFPPNMRSEITRARPRCLQAIILGTREQQQELLTKSLSNVGQADRMSK